MLAGAAMCKVSLGLACKGGMVLMAKGIDNMQTAITESNWLEGSLQYASMSEEGAKVTSAVVDMGTSVRAATGKIMIQSGKVILPDRKFYHMSKADWAIEAGGLTNSIGGIIIDDH